jgi:hypothetical protein
MAAVGWVRVKVAGVPGCRSSTSDGKVNNLAAAATAVVKTLSLYSSFLRFHATGFSSLS